MNQTVWQKLKRVRWGDLFHIFFCIAAVPLAWIFRKSHPDLWLLCDCRHEARDNAYWLYSYIVQNHPGQDVAFALDKHSPDISRFGGEGRLVHFGSFRHWVYYLAARNVISSQKASGPNAAVCYVLERYGLVKGNKVFLQHGIIKDCVSFLYYRYTHIRLFTCSVEREWEYVRKCYGYPDGYVKLLGLCRFDQLTADGPCRRQIVIMPTWRKWLSHPTGRTLPCQLEAQFVKSSFFEHWSRFLNSEDFGRFLKDSGLSAVFYLHREMQKYSKFFFSENSRVEIAVFPEYDVQKLLKESMVLITDYSSVAMDFAYMGKPLVYYQFDYKKFRESHLQEGFFDYGKDGFGDVCRTGEEVMKALERLRENRYRDCREYEKRRQGFFTLHDKNNCFRTYEAIKQL